MSIIRMAAMPLSVRPTQPAIHNSVSRGHSDSFGWHTLLADGYAAAGLMLIAGYLLWTLCLGDATLPWVGELSTSD